MAKQEKPKAGYTLTPVESLPSRTRIASSVSGLLFSEFLTSGAAVVEVRCEKPRQRATTLLGYLKGHPEIAAQVKVSVRASKLYLSRVQ